jgi:hypothetical protein
MSDGPEWFAPRRFGFGTGAPISWQGWALTLGFVGIALAASLKWSGKPIVLIAVLAPVTIVFMVVAARTTRGGWRWRWGRED